jgi:hypothetical protein
MCVPPLAYAALTQYETEETTTPAPHPDPELLVPQLLAMLRPPSAGVDMCKAAGPVEHSGGSDKSDGICSDNKLGLWVPQSDAGGQQWTLQLSTACEWLSLLQRHHPTQPDFVRPENDQANGADPQMLQVGKLQRLLHARLYDRIDSKLRQDAERSTSREAPLAGQDECFGTRLSRTVSHTPAQMDESYVRGVVDINAYGDRFCDLAAWHVRHQHGTHHTDRSVTTTCDKTAGSCSDGSSRLGKSCRKAKPSSFVGLWPNFALLNHSCLPNCVHYVLPGLSMECDNKTPDAVVETLVKLSNACGAHMVVRVVDDIPAGTELTISYQGELLQWLWATACACSDQAKY